MDVQYPVASHNGSVFHSASGFLIRSGHIIHMIADLTHCCSYRHFQHTIPHLADLVQMIHHFIHLTFIIQHKNNNILIQIADTVKTHPFIQIIPGHILQGKVQQLLILPCHLSRACIYIKQGYYVIRCLKIHLVAFQHILRPLSGDFTFQDTHNQLFLHSRKAFLIIFI